MEIWKDIQGFGGNYQISNTGKVKSFCMVDAGRILKFGVTWDGYRYVNLRFSKASKVISIHRLVALAFIPNTDNKNTVNHIDGNKLNNNVENLEWNTLGENKRHSSLLGLCCRGERVKSSKLTKSDIIKIREMYSIGMKQHSIAQDFPVSSESISMIVNRKTWKHI